MGIIQIIQMQGSEHLVLVRKLLKSQVMNIRLKSICRVHKSRRRAGLRMQRTMKNLKVLIRDRAAQKVTLTSISRRKERRRSMKVREPAWRLRLVEDLRWTFHLRALLGCLPWKTIDKDSIELYWAQSEKTPMTTRNHLDHSRTQPQKPSPRLKVKENQSKSTEV